MEPELRPSRFGKLLVVAVSPLRLLILIMILKTLAKVLR